MANEQHPNCPACRTAELITISMTVAGTSLAFSTCHQCEVKWWFKDGRPVELSSVIGLVGAH
jgi:DNA polymerase III alpha subunit (gram-positive type)